MRPEDASSADCRQFYSLSFITPEGTGAADEFMGTSSRVAAPRAARVSRHRRSTAAASGVDTCAGGGGVSRKGHSVRDDDKVVGKEVCKVTRIQHDST